MIGKRIIPCLDVRDGRVVKGTNFEGVRDVADPVAMARRYNESCADELVFYDITASSDGRALFADVLSAVASEVFIPLTVGGGVRTLEDFDRVLKAGADKVSVNSGAIADPPLIGRAAKRYGDQCVVLSMDVKRVDGTFRLFANGGRVDTGIDALAWARAGVEAGAGEGASIPDADYTAAGAVMTDDVPGLWADSELVLKVKEPIAQEYPFLRPDLLLFTYLHLAADRALTEELLAKRVTSIAYETVETDTGALPLLAPMSEIAGRLAAQVGADALLRPHGGAGVLLGGAAGVRRGSVVVLGGGTAGLSAARVAAGMGADVTVFDVDPLRMRRIEEIDGGVIRTRFSTELDVARACAGADLVIGAVLVPGARTPSLVTRATVETMRPGSVLVDIAIDQGGCFEDSRPTTHSEPTFEVDGKIFYCVANMPGAVPHTSTYALTNATLPYALALADEGWRGAIAARPDLARGLSTHDGALYTAGVGEALELPTSDVADLLA